MIKDLTDIFTKGILNSANYNPKTIQGKLENLPNIRCVFYDDSPFDNWYLITRDDEKGVAEYYGFLSYRFPVALLMSRQCAEFSERQQYFYRRISPQMLMR